MPASFVFCFLLILTRLDESSGLAYNDAATVYNTKREVFPSNIIANMFNFELASFLEIDSEEKREMPEVKFS